MKKKKNELNKILKNLKIFKNDTVMIHGDAGIALNFCFKHDPLKFFFDNLISYIGKNGNILIPTFTVSFCKKKKFDIKNSKSEVGLFSENFRKRKDTCRSNHPIFSFAIYGKKYQYFNNSDLSTCFGKNSLFDLFYKINGKILILGSTFEKVVTFVHYIEERLNVNYRFLKKFDGLIICNNKKKKIKTSYYVRKLNIKKRLITPLPLSKILNKTKIGRYNAYSIESKKLFEHCKKHIIKNNEYLIG